MTSTARKYRPGHYVPAIAISQAILEHRVLYFRTRQVSSRLLKWLPLAYLIAYCKNRELRYPVALREPRVRDIEPVLPDGLQTELPPGGLAEAAAAAGAKVTVVNMDIGGDANA